MIEGDVVVAVTPLEGASAALAGKRVSEAANEKMGGWLTELKATWDGLEKFGTAFASRGAEAAQKRTQESIKQREAMRAEADRLTESLMTPMEQYTAALTRAKELKDEGLISQETYDREVERQKKMLEGEKEAPSTGLASFVRAGSAEAAKYEAQLNIIARGSGDTEAKKQTGLQERIAKAVEAFNESGGGDVVFDLTEGTA